MRDEKAIQPQYSSSKIRGGFYTTGCVEGQWQMVRPEVVDGGQGHEGQAGASELYLVKNEELKILRRLVK